MRIPEVTASRIPHRVWRVAVSRSGITKSARIFADVLSPFVTRSGRLQPARAEELARRYARARERRSITPRRVRQLIAELRAAGLLDRLGRPAPGRPARYMVQVPGSDLPRPMTVRPRGISPKRLHASFARELHSLGP